MSPRGLAMGISLLAALTLAACGGSDSSESTESEADPRDAALASLELTTEATSLEADMARLVEKLGDKPSAQEREQLAAELERLQQRAEKLIAGADADSTFEVELEEIAGSGAEGEATLVDAQGEIALDGSIDADGKKQALAVHSFGAGEGASVCPPDDAASGSDKALDGSEAEDFYGPAEIDLGAAKSGDVATAESAGKSAPLTARALVLAGPDENPLACGVPRADVPPAEQTATTEAIAAANETAGATLDIVVVLAEPTSERAAIARESAEEGIDAAGEHLTDAADLVEAEFEGSATADDEDEIEALLDEIESSEGSIEVAFANLDSLIESELAAEKRREQQREAAEAAAEAAAAPVAPEEPADQPDEPFLDDYPSPEEDPDFQPPCEGVNGAPTPPPGYEFCHSGD